jgi:hypothetical protein
VSDVKAQRKTMIEDRESRIDKFAIFYPRSSILGEACRVI